MHLGLGLAAEGNCGHLNSSSIGAAKAPVMAKAPARANEASMMVLIAVVVVVIFTKILAVCLRVCLAKAGLLDVTSQSQGYCLRVVARKECWCAVPRGV